MKIAVIGGGGVRSPLLARSIAFKSKEIGIDEVVFMDNQIEQLDIYGTISKIASAKINPNLHSCLLFTILTLPKHLQRRYLLGLLPPASSCSYIWKHLFWKRPRRFLSYVFQKQRVFPGSRTHR